VIMLCLAIFCAVGAIFARRVGVALIPAVLFAIWIDAYRSGLFKILYLHRIKFAVAGFLVLLACAGIVATSAKHVLYLPDFQFNGSVGNAVLNQITMRLSDFGELVLNLPGAKFARLRPVILAVGALLALLIGRGFWRARRNLHPTHVYFLVYLAILAIWPFADARFWIPVLPLIGIVVFQAIVPPAPTRPIRCLAIAYFIAYAALSVVAVIYTTRITCSGPRFSKLYGDPGTQARYQSAYANTSSDPDDDWAYDIQRFGMNHRPERN
jgi:hypothetical protein